MLGIVAGVLALTVLVVVLRSLWIRSGMSTRQTVITIGVALLVVAVLALTVTGRLNWIVTALAAVIGLTRWIGGGARWRSGCARCAVALRTRGTTGSRRKRGRRQRHDVDRESVLSHDVASRVRTHGRRNPARPSQRSVLERAWIGGTRRTHRRRSGLRLAAPVGVVPRPSVPRLARRPEPRRPDVDAGNGSTGGARSTRAFGKAPAGMRSSPRIAASSNVCIRTAAARRI